MGLLDNIRLYVHNRSLQQRLNERPVVPLKHVSLASAKTVGLFFDGTEIEQQHIAQAFAEKLKSQGKQVRLLAYLHLDVADGDFPFPSFTKKQVDWAMRPKAPALDDFLNHPFDLFFCLSTRSDILSDYVALLVRAGLKVGPVSEKTTAYDLMVDAKPNLGLERFIQQTMAILEKTNVQYQPA